MNHTTRGIHDGLCLIVIRLLRGYSLYTPFRKGLWRVDDLVTRVARLLSDQHRMIVRSRDGRKFCVDPKEKQYHMGLLGMGSYEPIETKVVTQCLSQGNIAIDVGANIGWYTTLLSQLVGPSGAVHAFEPVISTHHVLETNCRLNECANVKLNSIALGDRDGTVTMHYFPDEPCGNASTVRAPTTSSVQSTCDVTTLDAYVLKNRLSGCDFIKCDAEGAEMAFIKGASSTLQKFFPTILLEVNPVIFAMAGYSPADLLRKIREHVPYRFFSIDKGGYEEIKGLEMANQAGGYSNVLCVPDRSMMLKRIFSMPEALTH